jgi:hypothetical protein
MLKQVVHKVTADLQGWYYRCRCFVLSMFVSRGDSFTTIFSIYVAELCVHHSQLFNYKLLFCTTFPHFVSKIALIVRVHVCVRVQICACMHEFTANPLRPSQTIWTNRQIFIDRLCHHLLFAQEGPLLFGFHIPSWIIQHGGHVNFWAGHNNKRQVCSAPDIMCGGRIL